MVSEKKHNTTDAFTKFILDTVTSLDNKNLTIALYVDLSRAFDTLNHDILLQKLEFYGVRGVALDWFRSYISDRKHYVHYSDISSKLFKVTCGVPQGSVLGPLLFILYINDFSDCINMSSILFADDTTTYVSHRDIPTLYNIMNANLKIMGDWYKANLLSLNILKTNYMLFTFKQDNEVPNLQIDIDDMPIERKEWVKFLGLDIDQKLKWDKHTETVKHKLSKCLYAINKAKYILPKYHLRLLYTSLVLPHLSYGLPIWGATYQAHLNKLIIMQKKIIRMIAGARYDAHTLPLFHNLGLMNLADLHRFHVCKFVFTNLNSLLPTPLNNIFISAGRVHEHMTRLNRSCKLHIPLLRTTMATHSMLYWGPTYWNNLPFQLYHSNEHFRSSNCFFVRLKNFIIS